MTRMASNSARTLVPHHGVPPGWAVVCRTVVGSHFRNNYQFLSLLAIITHSHCSLRGSLIVWGVGPAYLPLLGYVLLMHNSDRGTSTLVLFPASCDVHVTLRQVLCTNRQGSFMRWTVFPATAPLRGFHSGLRSPTPCRSGLVRAYGFSRVYDPRHFCVPCTFGAPRWPSPPLIWPDGARLPPATTAAHTLIRFGAQHGALPCRAVGYCVVVGRKFRNNYHPPSFFPYPPVPYTILGPLTTGGSGLTQSPLSGSILQTLPMHLADRGDRAILTPCLAPSTASQGTLSRVPCPTSLGAPPRWTSPHLPAPLRGSTPGLRSPPPGRPGLVRAYGSTWVYDPRHYRVHRPSDGCLRLRPPTRRSDAARSAGPQPGAFQCGPTVARGGIGTSWDSGNWLRWVHAPCKLCRPRAPQSAGGGNSVDRPALGFALLSSSTHSLKKEMRAPHDDAPFRATRPSDGGPPRGRAAFTSRGLSPDLRSSISNPHRGPLLHFCPPPNPWTLCNNAAVQSSAGSPSPPPCCPHIPGRQGPPPSWPQTPR